MPPAGRDISVDYNLTGIEANIPLDLKLANSAPGRISDSTGVITIAKGDSSATIPVEIIADYYDEVDETFKVEIKDPVNADLGTITAITPTIEDNDAEPKVSIAELVSVTETDADITEFITVSLDHASSKTVTVPVLIATGTADENDYAFVNAPVVFNPDPTTTITPLTQDIPITIKGDDVGEKSEQFTISLGDPTNGDITGVNTISTITITDDEAPVLSIGNAIVVTEADQAKAMFPITASFSVNTITVYFTPTQEGDFLGGALTANESTSTTIDFTGGTSAMLPIPILNDKVVEENGSITITLVEDANMESGQSVITYSIDESQNNAGKVNVIDDDSLPVVSIVADSGNVAENAGSAKFMLTATGFTDDSNLTLSINATPAENESDFLTNSVADIPEDFEVKFSDIDSDNSYIGELEVTLDNDSVGEATGEIKLTLNADPDSAKTYQLGTTTDGVITILDDDAPELKISGVGERIIEADNVVAELYYISCS